MFATCKYGGRTGLLCIFWVPRLSCNALCISREMNMDNTNDGYKVYTREVEGVLPRFFFFLQYPDDIRSLHNDGRFCTALYVVSGVVDRSESHRLNTAMVNVVRCGQSEGHSGRRFFFRAGKLTWILIVLLATKRSLLSAQYHLSERHTRR